MDHKDIETSWRRDGARRFLHAITVLAMLGAAVFVVATLVAAIGGDRLAEPVPIMLDADRYTGPLPSGARVTQMTADVEPLAGAGWRLTWWATQAVPAALGIAGLVVLRKLLAPEGSPFTQANARRLGVLTGLAVAYLFVGIATSLVEFVMKDSLGFDRIDASLDFGLPALLALVCSVLAEIWRRGVALQDEQELTV